MTYVYTTYWTNGPMGPGFFIKFGDVVPISTGGRDDYYIDRVDGKADEERKKRRVEVEALALLLLLQK